MSSDEQPDAMDRFIFAVQVRQLFSRNSHLQFVPLELDPETDRDLKRFIVKAWGGLLVSPKSSEYGAQLQDDLRLYFNTMNEHLDAHVGVGELATSNRATMLDRLNKIWVEEITTGVTVSAELCAESLNEPLPLSREPLRELQDRTAAPYLGQSISAHDALQMKDDYLIYLNNVYIRTSYKESVFNERYQFRDDIDENGFQVKKEISSTNIEMATKLLATDLARTRPRLFSAMKILLDDVVERNFRLLDERLAASRDEDQVLWASSPEIPSNFSSPAVSLGSSPPVINGIRSGRVTPESDADEISPSRLRRLGSPERSENRDGAAEMPLPLLPGSSPATARGVRRNRNAYESDADEHSAPPSRRRRFESPDSSAPSEFRIHDDETAVRPLPSSGEVVSEHAPPVARSRRSDLMPAFGAERRTNTYKIPDFPIHEDVPGEHLRALVEIRLQDQVSRQAPDNGVWRGNPDDNPNKENVRPIINRPLERMRERGR
ncbi:MULTISPECIES: hypothetical protein [unclassified Neorhizobium]|uniref:hypothetical protein n=1 Tax=unclassified Neorhizobium TaxID=2629175 RepID=UPI001FF4CA21|nr:MULTISPECIES: hypothetical protein [unclassified Neorhizobium]MCJ9670402.1 hypothetical protein [Neorhizobium sp. SHOUNA12B]MCJ9746286.1 hypothetical protein [Neorhizobium sp. SHOUNA12A]